MARCNKNKCTTCDCEDILPVSSNDVIYEGSFLPNLGIPNGTILTEVLQTIDTFLGSFNPPNIAHMVGGTSTSTADGYATTYTFPHSLGILPDAVSVNSTSDGSTYDFTVTYTADDITVSYSVAPPQGVQLSWTWMALQN